MEGNCPQCGSAAILEHDGDYDVYECLEPKCRKLTRVKSKRADIDLGRVE